MTAIDPQLTDAHVLGIILIAGFIGVLILIARAEDPYDRFDGWDDEDGQAGGSQ